MYVKMERMGGSGRDELTLGSTAALNAGTKDCLV